MATRRIPTSLLISGLLAVLVVLGAVLWSRTDPITVAVVFTAAASLSMNVLFYYTQSKRRGDFIPLYPDTGIAIFFSITTVNALLLFFRFHRTYGNNPYTLGLYYPVPLPKALVLRALVIVTCANLLFIITFYSRIGPAIVSRVPDPPSTSEMEQALAKHTLIPFLLFGVSVALLGLNFSGVIFVVARNFLYVILPLLFIVGIRNRSVVGWPTVAALGTISVLFLAGNLSFVIVPVLGLIACYHFLYQKLNLLKITPFGIVFVAIAIVGKQYRLRPTLPFIERLQVSIMQMIVTFPSMFARNVIGRLSPFESFATVLYFVESGKVDLHFGRQYPALIGKMLPRTEAFGDTYFNGGYYTHVLFQNNAPPGVTHFITEDYSAALGSFGSWFLNFHLVGIVIGIVVFGIIFRVWTQLLEGNTDNPWVIAFHASNIWLMYSFWAVNTRPNRALLLRATFFVFVFYSVRYSSRYLADRRSTVAE